MYHTVLFFLSRILSYIIFVPVLIGIIIHCIIRPSQFSAYLQRLGLKLPNKPDPSKPVLWLHAVSVGEVGVAVQLIRRLQKYPGLNIVLSFTTPTGFEMARKNLDMSTIIPLYYPVDISLVVNRVIKHIQPWLMVIIETEIWPEFIISLNKKKIPVIMINGRLGDKEFRNYKSFRFYFKPILQLYDSLSMQGEIDLQRIQYLGAPQDKTLYTGNIKFDVQAPDLTKKREELASFFPDNSKLKIIFASTHRGEEEILLGIWKELVDAYPNIELYLVPRHPSRAKEVAELVQKYQFKPLFRSNNDQNPGDGSILILDTVGELLTAYSFCDIVIMGGSFSSSIGGHNIIEPAMLGLGIITGPHMDNFKEVITIFKNEKAVVVSEADQLLKDIKSLLKNPDLLNQLRERSKKVVQNNQGALNKNIELIIHTLEKKGGNFG